MLEKGEGNRVFQNKSNSHKSFYAFVWFLTHAIKCKYTNWEMEMHAE